IRPDESTSEYKKNHHDCGHDDRRLGCHFRLTPVIFTSRKSREISSSRSRRHWPVIASVAKQSGVNSTARCQLLRGPCGGPPMTLPARSNRNGRHADIRSHRVLAWVACHISRFVSFVCPCDAICDGTKNVPGAYAANSPEFALQTPPSLIHPEPFPQTTEPT